MNATQADETKPMDVLEGLPPSSKLVYKVLEYEGEMILPEIVDETLLPETTARYAVTRLEHEGVITSRPYPADARHSLYSVE